MARADVYLNAKLSTYFILLSISSNFPNIIHQNIAWCSYINIYITKYSGINQLKRNISVCTLMYFDKNDQMFYSNTNIFSVLFPSYVSRFFTASRKYDLHLSNLLNYFSDIDQWYIYLMSSWSIMLGIQFLLAFILWCIDHYQGLILKLKILIQSYFFLQTTKINLIWKLKQNI